MAVAAAAEVAAVAAALSTDLAGTQLLLQLESRRHSVVALGEMKCQQRTLNGRWKIENAKAVGGEDVLKKTFLFNCGFAALGNRFCSENKDFKGRSGERLN